MRNRERPGLKRVRGCVPLTRRTVLKGMAAAGGVAAAGLPLRARAATSVNFVGWQGYDTFLEAGDFAAKSDSVLQKTYISTADEVITKLRLGSSQIDISTPYFIHDDFLAGEGVLEPLDLERIPNFNSVMPVIQKYSEANMTENGIRYAVPMTWGTICIVYNADVIPEPPTSWTDLLKDEYKGKVAIPADYPGTIWAWGRVVTGAPEPHYMTLEELDATIAMIIKLKKEHLRAIAPSYGDLVQMLASGEVIIAQGWEPVSIWVGESPRVLPAYPKEGTMGFIEGYAIGKGSEHIDAAYAFINNALSVEGQVAGAEANSMPVVNAEAVPLLSEGTRALYPYDSLEDFFNTKTQMSPMYPLEADGVHATWDDYLAGWESVLKA